MTHEFRLPDLGEGIREGRVMELRVAPGDRVKEDQPLLVVETDKAAVEIPSPYAGVIESIRIEEAQLIEVGAVMFTFAETDQKAEETKTPAAKPEFTPKPRPTDDTPPPRRKPASPAVRKKARQLGLDLETINGSGPAGRIVMADLESLATPSPVIPAQAGTQPAPTSLVTTKPKTIPTATPVTPQPPIIQTEIQGIEDQDQYGQIIRQPLSKTRKAIARIMVHSLASIPHVTDCEDADITDLDTFRRGFTSPDDPSKKIPTLPFVIRAVVRALQTFPLFNAAYDAEREEIIYKKYCHIAIGVQTDRGLIAPVIRDADRLSIPQLNEQLAVITENARHARFSINDTRGGTYTISNAGAMGGSRYSTPLITPPQVAVLALGKARRMPWVINDKITPRLILPLSHSMDHRLIDGAIEIAFIKQIINDLEHPARLLL